jgi:hypothetical protein
LTEEIHAGEHQFCDVVVKETLRLRPVLGRPDRCTLRYPSWCSIDVMAERWLPRRAPSSVMEIVACVGFGQPSNALLQFRAVSVLHY